MKLLKYQKNNNPGIIKAKYSLKASKEDIKQARGAFLPSLTVSASWSDSNNSRYDDSSVSAATLNASIPLFAGGLNKSTYNQSVIKEKQANDSLQQILRDIRSQTIIAYNNVLVKTEKAKALTVRLESFVISNTSY